MTFYPPKNWPPDSAWTYNVSVGSHTHGSITSTRRLPSVYKVLHNDHRRELQFNSFVFNSLENDEKNDLGAIYFGRVPILQGCLPQALTTVVSWWLEYVASTSSVLTNVVLRKRTTQLSSWLYGTVIAFQFITMGNPYLTLLHIINSYIMLLSSVGCRCKHSINAFSKRQEISGGGAIITISVINDLCNDYYKHDLEKPSHIICRGILP
jgi:hypothetical protein